MEASALRREDLGAIAQAMHFPGYGPAPGMSTAAVTRTHRNWQGYAISGVGYNFLVECTYGERWMLQQPTRRPNLTVHGAVRYALEKDKFFLLDEDGYFFDMFIIEKALVLPPKP